MKSRLNVILATLALSCSASVAIAQNPQGWVQINSPTSTEIEWIESQPNGNVWIANFDGAFRSTDFGESWTKINELGEATFPAFFSNSEGIAGRINGDALLTTDGGETWQISKPTELNSAVPYVVQPRFVFAVNYRGGISKSTDKGKTWFKREVDGFMGPIDFCDSMNGFTVGDAPSSEYGLGYRTTDGGEVWHELRLPAHDYDGVVMLSPDSIMIVTLEGYVLRSTDKGFQWNEQLLTEPGWGLDAIEFVNRSKGYLAGARGVIFCTTDGGSTWTHQSTPTSSTLKSLHFVNDTVGFAGGENGILLRTKNGGQSVVGNSRKTLAFNALTTRREGEMLIVDYSLFEPDLISIEAIDVTGKLISKVLSSGQLSAGPHSIAVSTKAWNSGVVFLRIEGSGLTSTTKIDLVR